MMFGMKSLDLLINCCVPSSILGPITVVNCFPNQPALSTGAKLTQKSTLVSSCGMALEVTSRAYRKASGQDHSLDNLVKMLLLSDRVQHI